jgi:hypothetical protein
MSITGRCFCGAVTFACTRAPIATRACWCRDCRYLASGNATINAIFKADSLTVTGNVADYRSIAGSGNAMRRSFCPTCGTQLFSRATDRPDLVVIRAGAFDDQEIPRPTANIWTSSAPSWACIDTSLPGSEGQPPPVA